MAETKKISPKARQKALRNWSYGNLTCFSQAHMQTFGYLVAMLPIVDDLYEKDEEKIEALSTYTTFFNTEPQIGTMVIGLTTGLEEARANGEHIDAETINGIRAGLMGPLAGLGDSIVVGTFIPILLGIALGLSSGGSVLGPLFYIVAWNLLMYFGMKLRAWRLRRAGLGRPRVSGAAQRHRHGWHDGHRRRCRDVDLHLYRTAASGPGLV